MRPPRLPCGIVVYCCLVSFAIIAVRLLHKQSSARLLYEIIDSQLQHGVWLNGSYQVDVGAFDAAAFRLPSNQDAQSPYLSFLTTCRHSPDSMTFHIRLPAHHLNISLTPPDTPSTAGRHFNPTFVRLPSWVTKSESTNGGKYVLVTRVVTEGLHQESRICLADICLPQTSTSGPDEVRRRDHLPQDARPCSPSDHVLLGLRGGMRCTTPAIRIDIPPTPALHCTGSWSSFPHIAGFHDPRVFWSNRGEPLIILNSASQYGCVGLWLLDLRTVYQLLGKALTREGKRKDWEMPTISYSHLTELTRIDRGEVEKNWMLFFPGFDGEAVVQYDALPHYTFDSQNNTSTPMNESILHTRRHTHSYPPRVISSSGGRTLARLFGKGHTTPNITSISEQTCFPPSTIFDSLGKQGHWHQATNALKLILCTRQKYKNAACGKPENWTRDGREVHFAIMHRKFSNEWDLPLRYERYVVVWEGREPYRVSGISASPLLFRGEKAHPWAAQQAAEVQDDGGSSTDPRWRNETITKRSLRAHDEGQSNQTATPSQHAESNAYFTYTPSLSWAWRPTGDRFSDYQADIEDSERDVEELENLGLGFLDDDVLLGIGLDDVEQVFVRVKADELVSCLRLCPDVETTREEEEGAGEDG